jgi:hypothetical protein
LYLATEISVDENFSKAGKRRDTRRSGQGRQEETYWSKKSGAYTYHLKKAVANFLRNIREHLHDVHSPG